MSEKEVMMMNDKEVEMNERGGEASRREEMTVSAEGVRERGRARGL